MALLWSLILVTGKPLCPLPLHEQPQSPTHPAMAPEQRWLSRVTVPPGTPWAGVGVGAAAGRGRLTTALHGFCLLDGSGVKRAELSSRERLLKT